MQDERRLQTPFKNFNAKFLAKSKIQRFAKQLKNTIMKTILKNQKVRILSLMMVLAGMVFLGIFMQGCSNEEYQENLTCDFQNPYDYVGKYHNEGLAYVLNEMKNTIRLKSDISKIEQSAYNLTKEFCQKNPMGNYSDSEEFIVSAIRKTKDIRLKSGSNNFSQTQLYFHEKFKNIMANPQGCNSLSDVLNKIRIIEKEIYESSMTKQDKEVLLITYAVGRNSLEFWLEFNGKTIHPRLKSGSEWNFFNWWQQNVTPAVEAVVESDFTGAAAGALEGLITGATGGTVVAPGPGTITGAVTGAVVGGASGAVYGSVVGGAIYFIF
jgi:hypothetical protein